MNLPEKIEKAIHRRKKLSAITNAMRLVNGAGDGLEGLFIDRYNKHFCVQVLKDRWEGGLDGICRALSSTLAVDYLIVKVRRGTDFKNEVLVPGESVTVVEEQGLKFAVDLNDGLNCGLFLDMRSNRLKVKEFAQDKRVLNCFSYTCSFGVYACAGGAAETINTDINRKALERGRQNYRLNGLACTPQSFIKMDSASFLSRAVKKANAFDIIVLDPPSFARYAGKVFQAKQQLPRLIAMAAAALKPGGALLAATNYSEISHADLEGFLARGLEGRPIVQVERLFQAEDFPGSNDFKESYLAGLWVRFP